ncbi:MAG: hypothetical protein EOP87_03325 [Verrucomicrobiaceae bacterium]|nr:MAG: hypothetical protein EOP87_03325 [Verrucomicrobiaceae bacterium]
MHIEEYTGKVGLDDLRSLASAMAEDPDCLESNNRLVDLSGADLELSSDEVLRYALIMRSGKSRSGAWHAFAVKDAAAFSLVRMLSYWARVSDRCRIFSSRDEAERWLEMNSPAAVTVVPAVSVA